MTKSSTQNGIATTTKKTFSRTTSISQVIHAKPSVIWNLITNANDFARWNSTIVSIEGEIKEGEKIALKSTLDENRVFKLKVKEAITNKKLAWGDAMGSRIFTLEANGADTVFMMSEKIGGPIFPLFASKIPSFDASFEAFTADLKQEAEKTAH
jgi:uncharacterized protein YndB with AHSA1/START domain